MSRTYTLQGFGFEQVAPNTLVPDFTATASIVAPVDAQFQYTVLGSGTSTVFFFSDDLDTITVVGAGITAPQEVTVDFQTTAIFRVEWSGGVSDVLVVGLPAGAPTNAFFFLLGGDPIDGIDTRAEFDDFAAGYLNGSAPSDGNFAPGQPIQFSEIPWDSITSGPDPLTLTGTAGADTLTGGSGDDRIDGQGGDDSISGLDGNDTLIGGTGNDTIIGGQSDLDIRDQIFAGAGNDFVSGGAGNDELRGDAGNDTIEGGFGVDTVIGGTGDDVLTGSAFSDLIFGGDGEDFINGGFGFDRVNGGAGADRFFHLGIRDHGSDWIQDYDATQGDVLQFGIGTASASDFQVNIANTASAGADGVDEAFIIYRPTGQIMWALVDGAGQDEITLRIGSQEFDLLA